MAVLIDTDVVIQWERGDAPRLPPDGERFVSVITASELVHGVHRSTGAARTRRSGFVEFILGELPLVPITTETARVHAEIWAALEDADRLIGVHDLWIAATAVAHGFALATRNTREFGRIPGLHVIDLG